MVLSPLFPSLLEGHVGWAPRAGVEVATPWLTVKGQVGRQFHLGKTVGSSLVSEWSLGPLFFLSYREAGSPGLTGAVSRKAEEGGVAWDR